MVATLVAQQGLAPLVYRALSSTDAETPRGVLSELKTSYLVAVLRAKASLEPTLRQTLSLLESENIRPIVLKGAALAYTAYSEPAHRTMADIDLLLRPEELERASKALTSAEFVPYGKSFGPDHQHLPVHLSAKTRVGVELHHHLIPESNPYRFDLDLLRDRSEQREIAGVPAYVLAPHDALLHVCLHLSYGHRYQWFPLRSLTDILAITTAPDLCVDWNALVRATQQARASGVVYWPLRLGQQWLGAPIPESVLRDLAPAAIPRKLIAGVLSSGRVLGLNGEFGASGADVLHDIFVEVSLYGGCSTREQLGALVRGVFPRPDAISHLPPEVTSSRFRYAAALGNPGRIVRGAAAFGRLVAHLPKS